MKHLMVIIILIFSMQAYAQSLQNIEWLSEDFPPFNYVDENNARQGLYIDVLKEIWQKTGIEKRTSDIKFFPWARGIKMLEKGPGTALFAMGMTEERLKKYKFVGPVKGINIGIIAKKDKHFRFSSISDVNQAIRPQRLGVLREDSGHQLFLKSGGDEDLLYFPSHTESMIKMLDVDRLDAISLVNITAFWEMKNLGFDSGQYELVYLFTVLKSGFAFHKDTDQGQIDTLQKAFDSLYEEGIIKAIEDKYLK